MTTILDLSQIECFTEIAQTAPDKYTLQFSNKSLSQVVSLQLSFAQLTQLRNKTQHKVYAIAKQEFPKHQKALVG